MKFKNKSLYLLISTVVIFVVSMVMLSLLIFDYANSKHKLTKSLEQSSQGTIERLGQSIKPFITSYSVDEYEKLIETELSKQSVLAIVVEDYITGKLLGEIYVTGKMRDKNWNVVEYDKRDGLVEEDYLYYENIVEVEGDKVAKIKLYSSYRFLHEELNNLIIKSLITLFFIALFLIFSMFFFIKNVLLEPISQMVDTILVTDENGIPKNMLKEGNTTEISLLTRTINTMLKTIKSSKDKLLENQKIILQQKEEFESIFKYSKDAIAIVDLDSNFLEFNTSYSKLVSYSEEELKSKSCIELTVPEERDKSKKVLEDAITFGFVENFEKTCMTKNGGRVRVSMTVTLFPDKERFLIVARDITALKLLQEQSKLASMGEMIGNIAHQWRQPLSVISTASTGVLMYKDMGVVNDEFLEKEMNQINDNAQYLSKTIDDFRDFIKGDRQEVTFNLTDDINSFLHLVEGSIKANNINLVKSVDEQLLINGYPNELIQCLINIFNNAKDALKESDNDRYIFISTTKKAQKAYISIKDSAGGIPEEILPHIFEPYFTTKHKSKGTGLGLSMTYNLIVEGMNGSIDANNVTYEYEGVQHKGAEFIIELDLV